VFTSTIAFIDIILEPDKILSVGFPSMFVSPSFSPLQIGSPISALEKAEGEVSQPMDKATTIEGEKPGSAKEAECEPPTIKEQESEHRYIFRRENDVWYMRFEDEDDHAPHSENFIPVARLLNEPGRKMNAIELVSEGIDLKKKEASEQAYPGSKDPQIGIQDETVTEEVMDALKKCIETAKQRLELAQEEHDIEKVEELKAELAQYQNYLDSSTRDPEGRGKRRPRPLGDPGLMENARKAVDLRISRAKEYITKKNKMPRFAKYLDDKIIPVRFQPEWVYTEDIYWKVNETQ
jgi:hypothetical protein